MKDDLLKILRCPICDSRDWGVAPSKRNEVEILEGRLDCRSCGRRFPIANGAVDLVPAECLTEVQRTDREKCVESDRRILDKKHGGRFRGQEWLREIEYLDVTAGRTEFLFTDLEFDSPSQRWVLDLGCGQPVLSNRFARLGFRVVALDFVPTRLDSALQMFERDGTYFERVAGLMARLPLANGSMDMVFSHASLHHATPLKGDQFRWYDPANMLDTLGEVKRVLKPDGLFIVSGEGEYPEEIHDKERELERKAQEDGCYEAFYKRSEYERAFREAGIRPHLWAQYCDRRLSIATFQGGRRREIVSAGDSINRRSGLLLRAPAIKQELDEVLGGWARLRPWPGGGVVPRHGAVLSADDSRVFTEGWYPAESDANGSFRWMGRDPATLAVEVDFVPGDWLIQLSVRAFSLLGEFDAALLVEREGRIVARSIVPRMPDAADRRQQFELESDLEAGPATLRCIQDGQMRVRLYFNGDYLATLEPPSDNRFHTFSFLLPADRVRRLNQLTLDPAYAVRPRDCAETGDDRWLSCTVRDVRIGRVVER